MQKKDWIILAVILVVAFVVRIYSNMQAPLVDHHSSQQASTMAIAKNYAENGIKLLYPQHDDQYNYQYGVKNENRYYFFEFPLYSAFTAIVSNIFPKIKIEIIGRFITLFSSLITIGVLYYLAIQFYDKKTAIFSVLIFTFFPFFIFFSRVALSDMFVVTIYFISLLLMYFFTLQKNKLWSIVFYTLTLVFFSTALLIRPAFGFFILPIVYLFYKKYGILLFSRLNPYLFIFLSLIPIFFWQQHVNNFPNSVPFTYFISGDVEDFSYLETILPSKIFLIDVLFAHVQSYILGGGLIFFVLLSLYGKIKSTFSNWLIMSSFIYLLVFQTKHSDYELYQVLILPSMALSVGVGLSFLFKIKQKVTASILIILTTITLSYSFYVSYHQTKYYFNVSDEQLQIAKVLKIVTEKDDRIITDTDGNTTLLYLTNRKGATSPYAGTEQLRADGYAYIMTANKDRIEQYKIDYTLKPVFENDKFSVFKL
jgi:4-amino-4-deoxy-L-arabinose transferase-like glycosyltransferase